MSQPPNVNKRYSYPPAMPTNAVIVAIFLVAIIVASVLTSRYFAATSSVTTQPGCPKDAVCDPGPIGFNQVVKTYLFTPAASGDITTLDPAMAIDASARQVSQLVFDSLVTLDGNLTPELWGADHLSVSGDGLTYVFHSRDGQRFSDGVPVRASDFAFALDRALNPCLATPERTALLALRDAPAFRDELCVAGAPLGNFSTLIGDAIVSDDSAGTLTLKLSQPFSGFLSALAALPVVALEVSALDGSMLDSTSAWLSALTKGPTGMGGSGIFYVASWDHRGSLVLKRNPHWWGNNSGKVPHFTEMDVHLYTHAEAAFSAYEDDPYAAMLDQVPSSDVADAATHPDYLSVPSLAITGVSFNWALPPFDNPDVRQAFCLAISRSNNAFTPLDNPTWHLAPQGLPGYNPNLMSLDGAALTGDSGQATQQWQAYLATQRGRTVPKLTLSYDASSTETKALATFLAFIWQKMLGLIVQLDPQSPASLQQAEERHTVQIAIDALMPKYPDPQAVLTQFMTGNAANTLEVSVPRADALLTQAAVMTQSSLQQQRIALYQQAEQQYLDAVAFCPLAQRLQPHMLRTWVYGMHPNANGLYPLDDWAGAFLIIGEPAP